MLKVLGLAAILAAPSLAMAQTEANKEYAPKAKHIDIDDADVVEGEFVSPEGPPITSVRGSVHVSLIKIRWNFVPEMIKSADDI
jgi:hypothetical protein